MNRTKDYRNTTSTLSGTDGVMMSENMELEVWRSKDARMEQHQMECEKSLELFRATINIGQNSIKSATLINGGATVALLAYISTKQVSAENMHSFVWPLMCFSLGVGCAALASGIAYLSQSSFRKSFEETFGQKEKKQSHETRGRCWRTLAIALVSISYTVFFVGSGVAYWALFKQK